MYRALQNGWHKDRVGSHVVRGNHVHHCGQTGIVGSLGAAFSQISNNSVHDCFVNRTFNGAEMATIKLHGAVDVLIQDNHLHGTDNFGIWLDWMAQGAMVLANLFHDNKNGDIFTEVDHGPITMANNLFLSGFKANSAGNAYIHNLVAGGIVRDIGPDSRLTPSLVAHETDIAGVVLANNGDHRFYNNVVIGPDGFAIFNRSVRPCFGSGGVYTGDSTGPSRFETAVLVNASFDAGVALTEDGGVYFLEVNLDPSWAAQTRVLVTTEVLGNATIPQQAYTRADNSSFAIDTDYFNAARDASNPRPGPIEAAGALRLQVWPKQAA